MNFPFLTQRRRRLVDGPVSESMFFEKHKLPTLDEIKKTPQTWTISRSLSYFVPLVYHSLILLSIILVIGPFMVCRWMPNFLVVFLPSQLNQLCFIYPFHYHTAINHAHSSLRNYAHFGDGARILPEITSYTYGTRDNDWLFKDPSSHRLIHQTPPYVVSDELMQIGDCWEIAGNTGTLGVLLSERTRITSVRLGSVHPNIVQKTSAAKFPRDLRLWGLVDIGVDIPPNTELKSALELSHKSFFTSKSFLKPGSQFALLIDINYDPRLNAIQDFRLDYPHWAVENKFQAVVLEVVSNWGSDRSCLYHFGVFGD